MEKQGPAQREVSLTVKVLQESFSGELCALHSLKLWVGSSFASPRLSVSVNFDCSFLLKCKV